MSFYEIAGLVLAVIPLVLEGLDAYPNSKVIQYVKNIKEANQRRREFATTLRQMNSGFQFAMLRNFTEIPELLSDRQVEVLYSDKSMGADFLAVWNEVKQEHPAEIDKTFAHTIHEITDVLNDMVELLNDMIKDTGISSKDGRETLRAIISGHEKDKAFPILNFSKRLNFAKRNSKRSRLIQRMERNTEILKELNKGQKDMNKFIAIVKGHKSEKSQRRFLDKVRECCDNIYHALSKSWRCQCHNTRSALLGLEKRETPETKEVDNIRFSLVLTFEHRHLGRAFKETEISIDQKSDKKRVRLPGDENKNKGTDYSCLRHVEDICMILATCSQENRRECLSLVLDEKRRLWASETLDRDSPLEIDENCTSLEYLLSQSARSTRYQPKGLDKRACLFLAANLASAILQLHATSWLPENWSSSSIYFPRPVNFQKPYVMVNLDSSVSHRPPVIFVNPYLVALGITLLELSERTSFIKWSGAEIPEDVTAKAALAWEWLDNVSGNMSVDYASAVQLCLKSPLTPGQTKLSLDHEEFRDEVCREIVQRLETNYLNFITPLQINQRR